MGDKDYVKREDPEYKKTVMAKRRANVARSVTPD